MPELDDVSSQKEFRKRKNAVRLISQGFYGLAEDAACHDGGDQVAIMAIDPGETTGWSIMALSREALAYSQVPILGAPSEGGISFWAHGQIDCGAKTGNAGTSGTRGFGGDDDEEPGVIPVAAGVLERAGRGGRKSSGTSAANRGPIAPTGRAGAVQTGRSGGAVALGVSTAGEAAGVSELMGIYDWAIEKWGIGGVCVLIEDFIPRKQDKKRSFLSPVRITAQLDYCLWLRGVGSWRQSGVDAGVGSNNWSGANDKRLEEWGFYEPRSGKGAGLPHARDADRHAITWLRRCKGSGAGGNKKASLLRAECWPGAFRT